jgi:CRP-like cAMP-binding protein
MKISNHYLTKNHTEFLISFLQRYDILSPDEIQFITTSMRLRRIKKGELFIGEGVVSNEFALVQSGFFRHFLRADSGEEKNYSITFPGQILASYSSLILGSEAQENIEAITDAELIVLPFDFLEAHLQHNINWLAFSKTILKTEYVKLEKRIFSLLNESPKQRYLELLNHRPHYIQQIPLKYLASFLGISARHLTRLRKEVTL